MEMAVPVRWHGD